MDTFTLVRNSVEKKDTRFRETFSIEKRVAIAFGISHETCSKKKVLQILQVLNFAKFLTTPFLQNTSGRLFLCFMASSDWQFLPQRFKDICCWKIDCGKHYRLLKYFYQISENPNWNSQSNCYI